MVTNCVVVKLFVRVEIAVAVDVAIIVEIVVTVATRLVSLGSWKD